MPKPCLSFKLQFTVKDEVHDETLEQTVRTDAYMLWLPLQFEGRDHFSESHARNFIVQIVQSLSVIWNG